MQSIHNVKEMMKDNKAYKEYKKDTYELFLRH